MRIESEIASGVNGYRPHPLAGLRRADEPPGAAGELVESRPADAYTFVARKGTRVCIQRKDCEDRANRFEQNLSLRGPDDSAVDDGALYYSPQTMGPVEIKRSGRYTLVVECDDDATGSYTLTPHRRRA